MDAFWAGVIGLGLSAGGYIAEVFRAGLQAVHKGQREAALAVGMTPAVTFRYIILPQAVRIVLPPLLNMLIMLLKDSSLCALISAFAMAWPLSLIARRVEARMRQGMRSTSS